MTPLLAFSLLMFLRQESQPLAQTALKLEETFSKLDSFQIQTSLNLTGYFNQNAADRDKTSKSRSISAIGSASYTETVSDVSAKQGVLKAVRDYSKATLQKKLDATETINLRPAIRLAVVSRADGQSSIISPDGPLTLAELDMLESHVFIPSLSGLLPSKSVTIGDQWEATTEAVVELTGIGPIESGTILCQLTQLAGADKSLALVRIRGEVTGPSEQGASHQRVAGQLTYDLSSKTMTALNFSAENTVLDQAGKPAGTMSGRFEMRRSKTRASSRLNSLATSPPQTTQTTSAILHHDTTRRLTLAYPRNWELISSDKQILLFQEPSGGTLRLVLDPSPTPSLTYLQKRIGEWIITKKGRLTSRPGMLQGSGYSGFWVKGELPSSRARRALEFVYILKQSQGRVALLTTSLADSRSETLRSDIQFMASRLRLQAPQ